MISGNTELQELSVPSGGGSDPALSAFYVDDPAGCPGEGDNGGSGVVTDFERDVQSLFDPSQVTYRNDYAANLSNGYTFLDQDGDGWYDHIEYTNSHGTYIYCGHGGWVPL
jgi:hypothetical protein